LIKVSRGCILGYDIALGPNVTLPPLLRVSPLESESKGESKSIYLGVKAIGYLYEDESEDGKNDFILDEFVADRNLPYGLLASAALPDFDEDETEVDSEVDSDDDGIKFNNY
jgi:hypothetical protein